MAEMKRDHTCTGSSVFAIKYEGGVVVATDTHVTYNGFARFNDVTRQFKVNEKIILTFSGDQADFQWLQNLVERQALSWQSVKQEITPKALHSYLTNILYSSRYQMNPKWTTLVVAGIEEEEKNKKETSKPYIGVITQRGVACSMNFIATGMGALFLNQAMEDEYKKKDGKPTKDDAVAVARKAIELAAYQDCGAGNGYEIGLVDATGVTLGWKDTVVGEWSVAETNCQYE